MARTAFDATKPDAATQNGTTFGASAVANDKALRDCIVSGQMEGFVFSATNGTGTAAQPQYFYWKNGTTWIRATNTWESTGDKDGNLTTQLWELSTNSGGAYDTIVTEGFTYDASGNLLTTTAGGSLMAWVLAKMAPLKKVIAGLASHIALTGASAHGLGTISTQAASSVAITGGTVNGTTVGASTPAAGTFTRASEQLNTYTPALNAGQALDWAKGGSVVTTNGTNALTFSNVPASVIGTHMVKVSSFSNVTWPGSVSWGLGGAPSIGAKEAIVSLVTVDGGTNVKAILAWSAA